MREAIAMCEGIAGRQLDWHHEDQPRTGDHRWWISDISAWERNHPADVRVLGGLLQVGPVDAIVECSAEPSVMTGVNGGSPRFLIQTNLVGA